MSDISPQQVQKNLELLREIFPDCVRTIEGEEGDEPRLVADFTRLKAQLGGEAEGPKERYHLDWPGKGAAWAAARRATQKRLSPQPDKSVDFERTEHLFIEGDNLDALKLLDKNYRGAIKFIYIDPPYNTGKDFVYRDKFRENAQDYRARGAAKDSGEALGSGGLVGRRHAAWLSMILPRLVRARGLLRPDGFIFISIDENEYANLKLVCDEVFGADNFVATFMWRRKKEVSNDSKNVAVQGEYLLCYARSDEATLAFEPLSKEYLARSYHEPCEEFPEGLWRPVPLTVSRGLSGGGYEYEIKAPSGKLHRRVWAYPEHRFRELQARGRVYYGKTGRALPQRVIYAHESRGRPTTNFWADVATNKEGKKEILELFGGNFFDTPKPTALIMKLLRLACGPRDIVLDFFAGSASSAHAVLKLNAEDGGARRFIMVQSAEVIPKNSPAGRAGYTNIAEIARARIMRAGEALGGEPAHKDWRADVGFRYLRVEC